MSKNDDQKENDKFYSELDQDKIHGSCCTCQSLALLFIFILIIASIGSFFLYKQITSIKVSPLNFNSKISFNDFTNRLNAIKLDNSGIADVTLSESDFDVLMSEGINVQNFILKDIQTNIAPEGMQITGTLVKPLSSKVVVSLDPVVVSGKIKFEIKKIQAGKLDIPKFMLPKIESSLNKSMDVKLSLIYQKINIEEIVLAERELILKGKLKNGSN